MSDIEAQLEALKEKAKRFDEEAPNFSLQKLLEYEKEDPLGVWNIINGPVGGLLALEDPVVFRELKLRAEHNMLDSTLRVLFARLPRSAAILFACECIRRALPLLAESDPEEDRPLRMVEIAEKFARGELSQEEFSTQSAFIEEAMRQVANNRSSTVSVRIMFAAHALCVEKYLSNAMTHSAGAFEPYNPAKEADLTPRIEEVRWQLSLLRQKYAA
jgi:hypothetical protein